MTSRLTTILACELPMQYYNTQVPSPNIRHVIVKYCKLYSIRQEVYTTITTQTIQSNPKGTEIINVNDNNNIYLYWFKNLCYINVTKTTISHVHRLSCSIRVFNTQPSTHLLVSAMAIVWREKSQNFLNITEMWYSL